MVFRSMRIAKSKGILKITISVLKHMVWSNLRRVLNRHLVETFPISIKGRRPCHLSHFIEKSIRTLLGKPPCHFSLLFQYESNEVMVFSFIKNTTSRDSENNNFGAETYGLEQSTSCFESSPPGDFSDHFKGQASLSLVSFY